MAEAAALRPRSAFAGLLQDMGSGAGLIVRERQGLGLAALLAQRGQAAALAASVRERFGIELLHSPRLVAAGGTAFVGTGPGAWLAIAEAGGNGFAAALAQAVGASASVTDQSDGYALLRLSGPKLRETLAKGVGVDLHPRALKPGDVVTTSVSHIGATLWRLPDDADGSLVFEIAVFRSLAGSFWHWLSESAAEFGLVCVPPDRG